jgi:hypothetical protein
MFRQESHIYLGPLEVNPLSRIAPYLLFYSVWCQMILLVK